MIDMYTINICIDESNNNKIFGYKFNTFFNPKIVCL